MAKITRSPPLHVGDLVGKPPTSVTKTFRRHADTDGYQFRYCGSGKAAMREILRVIGARPSANVLLPAYVPAGLVLPFADANTEARFYPIRTDLGPDLNALQSRLDTDTIGIVNVHYFGFEAPRTDALQDLAADHGCHLIADNAHAALSTDDSGRLLGTNGDVGFTSLRKSFPVPDGGVLFVPDPQLARALPPGESMGPARYPAISDIRVIARSLLANRSLPIGRIVRGLTGGHNHSTPPGPDTDNPDVHLAQRYLQGLRPMSYLTSYVCNRTDTAAVVQARRTAYLAWVDGLTDHPDIRLLSDRLPEGTAPQCCPIIVDNPRVVSRTFRAAGVYGVDPWPPLPAAVVDNDAFSTTNDLARRVLTLPTHQHVHPDVVRDVCHHLPVGSERQEPRIVT